MNALQGGMNEWGQCMNATSRYWNNGNWRWKRE